LGLLLAQRDYTIMRSVERFRFCLSRHIKILANFAGQRKCDKRLKTLIEAGYINRKKVLYGVPSVYSLAYKGKMLIGANKRQDKVRVDRIVHDITVLDTVIYFMNQYEIEIDKIVTEKELNSQRGFDVRKHQPDFIFHKLNKKHCVEIELTMKAKQRFLEIVQDNYLNYDVQHWVIPKNIKMRNMLDELNKEYQNIEIIEVEGVQEFVRANK